MSDESTYRIDETQSRERVYYPDRRAALSAIGLSFGALALELMFPSSAYAKKKATKYYAIIYKLNGGNHPKKQVKRVKRGATISVSAIKKPKRKGYKFVKWCTNKKLTKKAKLVYGKARKSKRTLYAKWKPVRYSIKYALNGGSPTRTLRTSYTIESKRFRPYAPSKAGYQFVDWYSNSQLTKRVPYIEHGSTGNKVLYAKWQILTYSVSYELFGGQAIITYPSSYTVKSSTITPFPPARSGHRFGGWYEDKGFLSERSSIKSGSTGNVTLYAKWLPTTYWDTYLEEKCEKINQIAESISNKMPSFVFITDMHLPRNTLVSPDLVRRVLKQTNSNMVVFGGDVLDSPIGKQDALDMLRFVRNSFPGYETHMIRGNHDANCQGTASSAAKTISDSEFLSVTASDRGTREGGNLYYYRDDNDHNVRFVFLDSGWHNSCYVDSAQLNWLKQRILELDEKWTVLVLVHQFFSGYYTKNGVKYPDYDKNGELIQNLLDSIYDESKAEIAGVLSGHSHRDIADFSSKGYPMISTTCDKCGKSGLTTTASSRYLGTTTEQAFDVVSLDTEKKMIYLTRIGYGKDRKYQYATPDPDTPTPDIPEPGGSGSDTPGTDPTDGDMTSSGLRAQSISGA